MKIAICTPYHGDVTAEYAYSLAKLIARTAQTRIEFNGEVLFPTFEVFMRTSSLLPQLRNMLVQDAMDWGANYLLWIDSDHKFADNALLRLLSLNLPVVGTNYPRRLPPHLPTAAGLDGQHLFTSEEAANADEVVPVASMGLGFCLIDMTVFDRLEQHAKADGRAGFWPLFAVEMTGDGTTVVGEDVYFFRQLRDAGILIHVDQSLSWTIGHVHTRVLTFADTPGPPTRERGPAVKVSFGKP